MKTLLDILIGQLDTRVPFISLSRADVFQLLNEHRGAWFGENEQALPAAYTSYRRQVNHSAVLPGYPYLENFLVGLLAQILRHRPAMLPRGRKVDYAEILDSPDKSTLIDKLIERELHELFYRSMEEIIKELRERYNFTITEEKERRLIEASLIRNCIMHNSSRADSRLSRHGGLPEGEEFEVSAADVHSSGIALRTLVRRMYNEAQANHGVGVEHGAAPNAGSAGAQPASKKKKGRSRKTGKT